MIRHLFKIIWNERRANAWIIVEYMVVFCILWFCCDFLCYIAKSYIEPEGFNLNHTYMIQMGSNPDAMKDRKKTAENDYLWVKTFTDRVKNYPGVENIAFSSSAIPYGGATATSSYTIDPDSLHENIRTRRVTSSFFDVFQMEVNGRIFDWEDDTEQKNIIISPDRHNLFGQYPGATTPIQKVTSLAEKKLTVIGYTNKVKDSYSEAYRSSAFLPMKRDQIALDAQISIRVRPEADKGFAMRFMEDMKDQLMIGPYFLEFIQSFREQREAYMKYSANELNSVYAITTFLIINIFLGIIGTFWYRTQSRKSEVGLRLALGATRRKVKTLMYGETLLLLFIASIVGVNICLNLGQTDMLTALGLPMADRVQSGAGIEQDFLNYGLTFLFLAVTSLFAVWYPAQQAALVPPAEALREE